MYQLEWTAPSPRVNMAENVITQLFHRKPSREAILNTVNTKDSPGVPWKAAGDIRQDTGSGWGVTCGSNDVNTTTRWFVLSRDLLYHLIIKDERFHDISKKPVVQYAF